MTAKILKCLSHFPWHSIKTYLKSIYYKLYPASKTLSLYLRFFYILTQM